ncbi:MAG: TIGR03986 family CRISPR-associated RAMP protein [Candidatus Cloacimonadales bacterium]|nr:TIGR03986 family CRISPR-associated RAMP protein [Candidatus Cloacimonadales bacterium]
MPNNSIPSPYNFVPLSKKVVYVDEWADQISHDVPFSDGESGVIELEVETETPVYIRNGGKWSESDKKDQDSLMQDFFKIANNEYFIPGTSFKGMLRNVFEIATFSKISLDDKRYSIRDLNNKVYTEEMTNKDKITKIVNTKVNAGWLKIVNNTWIVTQCDFARVDIHDLQTYYGSKIDIHKAQSSNKKYDKWKKALGVKFDILPGPHKHDCNSCRKHSGADYRTGISRELKLEIQYDKVINLGKGSAIGNIVFTGQPIDYSGQRHCKHMEFIFYHNTTIHEDVSYLKKDFEFIHSDEKGNPNQEWAFWKTELLKGKNVPVFYLEDATGITSMGLAMMYRLPYKYSIGQSLENKFSEHKKEDSIDLAEAVFGFISDKKSLKGRVQVGHFKATEIPDHEDILVKTVLGSPKPTYYPNYIEQGNTNLRNGKREYKTFMDKDAEIRGWKRYPIENEEVDLNKMPELPRDTNGRENEDVATMFKPLPAATKFEGKIRYHNLKPIEIGALLWSLTFGNRTDCRHKIGMAKPLGLGVIKIQIRNNKLDSSNYLNQFRAYMNKKLTMQTDFEETEQIKELVAMADLKVKADYDYRYPILDPSNRINEFVTFRDRDHNMYLHKYTSASSAKVRPNQTIQNVKIKKEIIENPKQIERKKIDDYINLLKTSNVKTTRKLIRKLPDSISVTDDVITLVGNAIKKRADYNQQKWATGNRNYLNIFEELKEKLKK